MTDDNPTPREQFLYTVAQEFGPNDVVFTGFHWPTIAAKIARRLHAPEFTAIYEAGIVHNGQPSITPTSTTEVEAFERHASMFSNSLDSLETYLKSGRLDGAVVEAATVDQFGNVNSTVIGDYEQPTVRLPGPGGANDILSYGKDVTLVNGSMDARRYQNRVSYVSSPGYLSGDGERAASGYPKESGPESLLCPMGRFVFDDTGRAQLSELAPATSVDQVREVTGWPIEGEEFDELPQPSIEKLSVIREEIQAARDRGYTTIQS